jgi:hypothetical protein
MELTAAVVAPSLPPNIREERMIRTATLALMLSLAASTALANDTTAELKTGGLEFTRSGDITMQEEKLYISPKEVRVDYVFRNTADKPVETYVAFPMPDITGSPDPMMDAGNTASDNFLGFSVVQDGTEIKPSLQQNIYSGDIDMTDVLVAAKVPLNPLSDKTAQAIKQLPRTTIEEWLTRGLVIAYSYDDGSGEKTDYIPMWTLKSAYWWKTTFPAGKDIHVSHKYHPSVGGTVATTFLDENGQPKGERWDEYSKKYCIDDNLVKVARRSNADMNAGKPYLVENWISYVLTTGANWLGPIGKFTLIVDKGEPDNYVSFCGTGVKKTGPTTFEMTATDFSPEKDLDILLLVPTQAP